MGGTLGDPRRRRFVGPVGCRPGSTRAGPECLVAIRTSDCRHVGAPRVPDQSWPRSATALPCPTNSLSRRNGGAVALRTRADSRPLQSIGCKWDLSAQPSRARLPQERIPGICPALFCRVRRIGTVDEEVGVSEDWRGRAVRPASASGRQPIPDSEASWQEHAPWRSRTRPPDVSPLQSGRLANLTRCGSLGQLGPAAIAPCLQEVSR